ncbi:DAK2 domain [Popillia japonica]|uniref:Triokinase/FMN cyclase n=1 Tax=Popillia japonica TaxID=7064 RepID=A0AAW1MBS8_POPJA
MQVNVMRMFCDRFLTSLDMYGFTVTIMKIHDLEILKGIDEPCEAPCWQTPWKDCYVKEDDVLILKTRNVEKEVIEMRGPRLSKRQMNTLLLVTQFACDALISCERQLNIMDAENGDGDTGTRLKRGMETINTELARHNINLGYPFVFFLSLSKLVEKNMGGTLGCIYSIMLEAAAKEFLTFLENQIVDGWLWLYALKRSVNAMITYTETKEGENTMLDPLSACEKAFELSLTSGMGDVDALGNGVIAAEESAQKTKISPRKYPDPGAHAVGIWLRAVYEGVKLRCE